ncbi:MAG: septal ring lytic transglycosylase RlpA family protein [bacterium]|nr:septal ring lytic transglycosylase RlpA family protein [bacterium]
MELFLVSGVVACVGGSGGQPSRGLVLRHRLPYGVVPTPGSTIFESPADYGRFSATMLPPYGGEIQLLQPGDALPEQVVIRDTEWPLVANRGPSLIYPSEEGYVSYYHEDKHLATGEKFRAAAYTAAHKTLPFGTIVRCTITDTGDSVVVMINDRGPYVRGRVLDLSPAAARQVGLTGRGIAPCRVEVLAYPLIETMGPKGNG